ncbi:aminotransferase class V-fold PLP-dependent enzyme [Loktanella sp. F6476L]|uniref:cysteine desulfurase family protein n=1 Tax=Loktanella sp. F6476L TaxID=2926405 RepID=UPI001FF5F44D|nr:aminotransferase class V-fold PLP-dependent enzyme [Loktanella sp. F6476L]MCK0119834.1 aminotransferase class V-fold PLP-dependent enzyme [Loktanella sp. F6476L]
MARVYLDHNATAPVRAEAKAAMIAAMDIVGNPSSVHAEGRAAKKLLEQSRADISDALGAAGADIVFTSGATESAALILADRDLMGSGLEHAAVAAWVDPVLPVVDGIVQVDDPTRAVVQLANSETGLIQKVDGVAVTDITQGFGRVPFAFDWSGVGAAILSAHKFGGPKGVGALIVPAGADVAAQIKGGGQEMGRRSGTENLILIAGFAAAAKAAQKDLTEGRWEQVAQFRNILEKAIEDAIPDTIFVGQDGARLPNTSCFLSSGWKGETQVMAMDLAGFAVSAGSACSSGKVKIGGVLPALGYSDELASCALRVSLGLDTTEDDVLRFADAWVRKRKKISAAAAA